MRETNTHIYFWGSFLSNFAYAPFTIKSESKEEHFRTSEHYFMYCKAMHFNDKESAQAISEVYEPSAAKAIGRKIKNFDPVEWDKISYNYMLEACREKFKQNPLLKYELVDTAPKIIVEASPLDKIWGVGLHENDDLILDEKNWLGENRLGKVLLQVREEMISLVDSVEAGDSNETSNSL